MLSVYSTKDWMLSAEVDVNTSHKVGLYSTDNISFSHACHVDLAIHVIYAVIFSVRDFFVCDYFHTHLISRDGEQQMVNRVALILVSIAYTPTRYLCIASCACFLTRFCWYLVYILTDVWPD